MNEAGFLVQHFISLTILSALVDCLGTVRCTNLLLDLLLSRAVPLTFWVRKYLTVVPHQSEQSKQNSGSSPPHLPNYLPKLTPPPLHTYTYNNKRHKQSSPPIFYSSSPIVRSLSLLTVFSSSLSRIVNPVSFSA